MIDELDDEYYPETVQEKLEYVIEYLRELPGGHGFYIDLLDSVQSSINKE